MYRAVKCGCKTSLSGREAGKPSLTSERGIALPWRGDNKGLDCFACATAS